MCDSECDPQHSPTPALLLVILVVPCAQPWEHLTPRPASPFRKNPSGICGGNGADWEAMGGPYGQDLVDGAPAPTPVLAVSAS